MVEVVQDIEGSHRIIGLCIIRKQGTRKVKKVVCLIMQLRKRRGSSVIMVEKYLLVHRFLVKNRIFHKYMYQKSLDVQ